MRVAGRVLHVHARGAGVGGMLVLGVGFPDCISSTMDAGVLGSRAPGSEPLGARGPGTVRGRSL